MKFLSIVSQLLYISFTSFATAPISVFLSGTKLSGQSMNLSGLNNRWQNFDNEMNKFSDTLEEQKKKFHRIIQKKI